MGKERWRGKGRGRGRGRGRETERGGGERKREGGGGGKEEGGRRRERGRERERDGGGSVEVARLTYTHTHCVNYKAGLTIDVSSSFNFVSSPVSSNVVMLRSVVSVHNILSLPSDDRAADIRARVCVAMT